MSNERFRPEMDKERSVNERTFSYEFMVVINLSRDTDHRKTVCRVSSTPTAAGGSMASRHRRHTASRRHAPGRGPCPAHATPSRAIRAHTAATNEDISSTQHAVRRGQTFLSPAARFPEPNCQGRGARILKTACPLCAHGQCLPRRCQRR